MGMKFLNKKGWHTGSLRNIENVWKAEQKNELEKKKLEELRKQIQEEKERSEFRRLQEQAGLIPRQERLEFLYDSGLSVGKPSSDSSFKSLESLPQPSTNNNNEVGASSSSSAAKQDAVPGALFEEKQQSANDSWRKLHSDPLLMIRQREQEALARIKNNPVKMAMIRESVEAKKHDESENKKGKRKHKKRSYKNRSDSEDEDRKHRKRSSSKHQIEDDDGRRHKKHSSSKYPSDSEDEDMKHKSNPSSKYQIDTEDDGRRHRKHSSSKYPSDTENEDRRHRSSKHNRTDERGRQQNLPLEESQRQRRISDDKDKAVSGYRRRNVAPKLSEEERAAKLREMQMDAELHEDQRWRRLKKADENDAKEASKSATAKGKSFLDAAQESVYGAEQGGSATIEESVRRRSHFRQSRSAAEGNAFRR